MIFRRSILITTCASVVFACSAAEGEGQSAFSMLEPLGTAGAATGGGGQSAGVVASGGATAGAPVAGSAGAAGAGGVAAVTPPPVVMPAGGAATGGADNAGGAGGEANLPVDGPGLYGTFCSACHGDSGVGAPMLGPEIQHADRGFATWLVRNGREGDAYNGPMLPIDVAALSDAQLNLILDYLHELPQPTTGEGLFLDYCANCHGADAQGGVVGHDLLHHAAVEDLILNVRSGHAPGDYANRIGFMPAVDAERLSDAELQLIADHLLSLGGGDDH